MVSAPSESLSSLISRLKSRDGDAWRRVADIYGPLVYYWCRQYGLSAQDAADVFQEVFTAVSSAIDRYQTDSAKGTFRGWLWTITRNKLRDHRRNTAGRAEAAGGTDAQQRLAAVPEQLEEDSDPATTAGEISGAFHRALQLVRNEFEDRTWQAFWRATVEGHSTIDIAADLGISANGVRQAKSRVLRRLKQEMGDLND